MEQISIFDYMEHKEEHKESGYVKYFAKGLKAYCEYWGSDWLEQIKRNPTVEMICKTICRFTKTHFFNFEGIYFDKDLDYYGARFIKGENVIEFYKCGKDSNNILATEPIEKLLDELI